MSGVHQPRASKITAESGCCVLFVDGLRYDLGRLLGESLEATFAPRCTTTEMLVDAAGLRSAIAVQDGQVLEGEAFPIPNRPDAA